jgi:GxxExxY protein
MTLNRAEIQEIADTVVETLGSDFAETVYQEAFLAELRLRGGYQYDRERVIPVLYKGQQVGFVRADVVVRTDSEEVVLELKVSGEVEAKEKVKNELRAYLRVVQVSQPPLRGVKRVGFVVTFPCTSTRVKNAKPPEKAAVDEVVPS